MAEEVKIVVRQESQGNALEQTRTQLNGVADAGKRASEATQKVTQKPTNGGFSIPEKNPVISPEQSKLARQVNAAIKQKNSEEVYSQGQPDEKQTKAAAMRKIRASIAAHETELAQAQAEGRPKEELEDLSGRLRERKLTARFMREQGLGEEEALGKAESLVAAQTGAKQRAADEKAAVKERLAGEREVTRELRDQESTRRRMTMRIGGMAAAGAVAVGGELLTDYFERQGIVNRDTASRSLNARQLQIQSGARGTSSQVQGEAWAAQDRLAELEANTPEVQNKAKEGIWKTALNRGAQGAVAGAFGGGGIPGAIVGFGVGAVYGAGEGWLSGNRLIAENDAAKKRERDKAADAQALATKKALEEETSLEVDAIHQRSKRTMSGIQAAQRDDLVRGGMATYRKFYHAGMTGEQEKQAREAAMLDTENQLRDKQISAASGLVDARAGAADIAAAARWSQQAMPGMDDVKRVLGEKLDALHSTVKQGGERATEAQTREDFGR